MNKPHSSKLHNLLDRRSTLIHVFFWGVLGVAFGAASNQWLAWTAAGLLAGILTGGLTEIALKKVRSSKKLYLRRILLFLLGETLLILLLVIPAYGAYTSTHPLRLPVSITPEQIQQEYQELSLTNADGLQIKGWYIPSKNGAAVITVHGYNGNRTHTIYHAQALAQAGYGVVLIDMHAHGESEGQVFNDWADDLDVLAALDYLSTRPEVDPRRIGAAGLSSGAMASLYAAAKDQRLQAVWADGTGMGRTEDALGPMLPEIRPFFFSTPLNWMYYQMIAAFCGVPPGPTIKERLPLIRPRPVYFVAGGQDEIEAALAQRYAQVLGDSARLWIIADVGHIGGFLAHPEEYYGRMLEFFDQTIGAGS
ncbi:MAG: alpha/beta fold hydrolase [Chloroflexota bacterium]